MNKKALTETDIRSKFITPALLGANGDKWNLHTQIREQVCFTRGRVIVRGKTVRRGEAKKADYILPYKPNLPLAVIEAKDNTHAVGVGTQQRLEYAESSDASQRRNVLGCRGSRLVWTLSSCRSRLIWTLRPCGSRFIGTRSPEIPLDQSPSPTEHWSRHRAAPGSCGSRLVYATWEWMQGETRTK